MTTNEPGRVDQVNETGENDRRRLDNDARRFRAADERRDERRTQLLRTVEELETAGMPRAVMSSVLVLAGVDPTDFGLPPLPTPG